VVNWFSDAAPKSDWWFYAKLFFWKIWVLMLTGLSGGDISCRRCLQATSMVGRGQAIGVKNKVCWGIPNFLPKRAGAGFQ
jgi:hypothetical protein